jgi:hypothetical protein
MGLQTLCTENVRDGVTMQDIESTGVPCDVHIKQENIISDSMAYDTLKEVATGGTLAVSLTQPVNVHQDSLTSADVKYSGPTIGVNIKQECAGITDISASLTAFKTTKQESCKHAETGHAKEETFENVKLEGPCYESLESARSTQFQTVKCECKYDTDTKCFGIISNIRTVKQEMGDDVAVSQLPDAFMMMQAGTARSNCTNASISPMKVQIGESDMEGIKTLTVENTPLTSVEHTPSTTTEPTIPMNGTEVKGSFGMDAETNNMNSGSILQVNKGKNPTADHLDQW